MKLKLFTILLLLASFKVFAERPELAANRIPAPLKKNAHAVVREYNVTVNMESLTSVAITEYMVVTILDRAGDQMGQVSAYTSKLAKLHDVYGYVYDEQGEQVEKFRRSDFTTIAGIDRADYDDGKLLVYGVSYKSYPYTVEYSITTIQQHSFVLPRFIPRKAPGSAVEKASLRVTTDSSYILRHHALNTAAAPLLRSNGRSKTYHWAVANLPAEKEESMSSLDFNGSPVVLLAPSDFQLGKLKGNMGNWKELGKFLYELNKDRDILSAEKARKVHQLTDSIKDPYEKIRVLYKYMQQNTRYVSVQYGVGGWQTLDAKFLSENQYGDCKALSNYMQAMLKEAGIISYPAVIYSGVENNVHPLKEFACNMFNHEILCVPFEKDTVWLECTSPYLPAGYLGDFTDDRQALLITPDGGALVHTPKYGETENNIQRRTTAQLTGQGTVVCKVNARYTGIPAEEIMHVERLNPQDKDQYLHHMFDLASYSVDQYDLGRIDKGNLPHMDETVTISVENMTTSTGSYVALNVNLIPLDMESCSQTAERKHDIVIPSSYSISDTMDITVPDGLEFQSLPGKINEKTPFGAFSLEFTKDGSRLHVLRQLIVKEGVHKPQSYAAYEAWAELVANDDPYRLILKKK